VRVGAISDIASDWSTARELGLRIHAHAGRSAADEGAIAALAQKNLLGEDVTLVHCSYASSDDLDAIASSGTSIVLTPSTEMTDGMGAPPIQALIDRKIRPGLGIDTDREAPGDILAQMRATISLQHATYFDLRLAGKAGLPNLMTTREIIRHGTVDGARAVGLADVTGSLEPGRSADIVILRTDRPNIVPINDPIGAVVWGMDTSNVDTVLVGGRQILRNGELTTDVANVRTLATKAQQRVASAAGLLVGSGRSEM
jgi:cytosine/adenosine deaminase-related metal-dependent hydrolase